MSAAQGDAGRDTREVLRVEALMQQPNAVFVFGSNRRGAHGGGAARVAFRLYGAQWDEAEGLFGRSYALPTMDEDINPLTLDQIAGHVGRFIAVAIAHPELTFAVTRVGCGIAGFSDEEIAPMFADAPPNCELPEGWR